MDAEIKQQLYGGEISDYLPKAKDTTLKDDYKKMEDIYLVQVMLHFSLVHLRFQRYLLLFCVSELTLACVQMIPYHIQ